MDWLVDLLGLPTAFRSSGQGGGVIQGTASEATLVALLAARARTFEHMRASALSAFSPAEAEAASVAASHAHKEPEWHSKLVCYASDQAHSSVTKAAMIAGLHIPTQYRIIPSHPPCSNEGQGMGAAPYTMDVQALQQAMEKDRAAGLIPFFAVATMGTTSSGAFDPLDTVGVVCQAQGVWLHVDAAWAGAALACPELREQLHAQGLERVDSFAFNPHKWMRTNFDCCAMFVRERLWLLQALSITPVYLSSPEYCKGLVHDYRDWQVPLGRRFRSLKLWFVMRMYGAAALRAQIRCHCDMAREFSRWITEDPKQRFQLTVQPSLSLVCFHMRAGDAASEAVLQSAMASGKVYVVNTKLSDRFVLRLAIGGTLTKVEHVRQAWELLAGAASTVLAQNAGS